jgi:hypothetical protein
LLTLGGMRTAFFDGRTGQYRSGPDAALGDRAGRPASRSRSWQ